MLNGLLVLRKKIFAFWPLLHAQSVDKQFELVEDSNIEVSDLLNCIEREIFLRGLRYSEPDLNRHEMITSTTADDAEEQHLLWGMIVTTTMLAFQCQLNEDVQSEFRYLRSLVLDIMKRCDKIDSPMVKFRALLRTLVERAELDRFFNAFSIMADDDDFGAIVKSFYSETIFLSKTFMNLLVKITIQLRVVPVRTKGSGDPFLLTHLQGDAARTGKQDYERIKDENGNFVELEMKIDPKYQQKLQRPRGYSSIELGIGLGDITSVFQAGNRHGDNEPKVKAIGDVGVGEALESATSAESSSATVPSSNSSDSSGNQETYRIDPGTSRMKDNRSHSFGSASNTASLELINEEDLIAELQLVLADIRMNLDRLVGNGSLERVLLATEKANRSRKNSTVDEGTRVMDDHVAGYNAFDADLEEDHDDYEQVRWIKEQIRVRKWSSKPSSGIPGGVSGSRELLRALMESLLLLREPLMGSDNFDSFRLVMSIPDSRARIRNVGLLVAQAPSATFPLLSAILRLFHELTQSGLMSVPGACVCLCPILFGTAHRGLNTSSTIAAAAEYGLSFLRGGSGDRFGVYLRRTEVLMETSKALYISEALLQHTEQILSICESNR